MYGAPVRYHVKLKTMGRDDKFDEHAHAGFYVGPSPENPEEKWVWTGDRHITIGGAFVIDETRYMAPIHLDSEYFDSWPRATPDSAAPTAPPPPRPTSQRATVLKEPLENGTTLSFRYQSHDRTSWSYYDGTVVDWRRRSDNGVEHEIKWLDPQWPNNQWVNLASAVVIWSYKSPPPPMATAPAPPTTPAAAPRAAGATEGSAEGPVGRGADGSA